MFSGWSFTWQPSSKSPKKSPIPRRIREDDNVPVGMETSLIEEFDEQSNPSVVLTEHVSRKRKVVVEEDETIQSENSSIESVQPPLHMEYQSDNSVDTVNESDNSFDTVKQRIQVIADQFTMGGSMRVDIADRSLWSAIFVGVKLLQIRNIDFEISSLVP
jgi:hypothetical protein